VSMINLQHGIMHARPSYFNSLDQRQFMQTGGSSTILRNQGTELMRVNGVLSAQPMDSTAQMLERKGNSSTFSYRCLHAAVASCGCSGSRWP
jgi:hypothetical protein